MGFLLAKQYFHDYELFLLPFAVILIVTAHICHFRYTRAKQQISGEKSCPV